MKISFARNILANYVTQFYVTLVGIAMLPLYVRYMGVEAYGLVGFFAMLQAWFQLLDLGLSPTIARETANFNGGAGDALGLRRLLRSLEGIFIGVGIAGALLLAASSGYIAQSWLQVQQLPLDEVQGAVILMAVIVALRWISGIYRSAISGFERLVWLGGFNSAVATARFVLVIPFFVFVGVRPMQFFAYQLVVAVCEVGVLIFKTYRLLPDIPSNQRIGWHWLELRNVLKFSLSIAFTSSMWVAVTQADKLLLSKLLALSDYGYFTLAVLVSTGVMMIGSPITAALIPRLVALNARGDEAELTRIYRIGTQLVTVIAVSAGLVLAVFSEQLLWIWTGDATIVRNAEPVLSMYAAGYALVAVGAFPSYLQVAKGDLRLHVIGSALFACLMIPALLWATYRYGVVGAGYAWLGTNALYFTAWVPVVHRRFFRGTHIRWLLEDTGAIALAVFSFCILARSMITWPEGRLAAGATLALVSSLSLLIAAISASWVRAAILGRLSGLNALLFSGSK